MIIYDPQGRLPPLARLIHPDYTDESIETNTLNLMKYSYGTIPNIVTSWPGSSHSYFPSTGRIPWENTWMATYIAYGTWADSARYGNYCVEMSTLSRLGRLISATEVPHINVLHHSGRNPSTGQQYEHALVLATQGESLIVGVYISEEDRYIFRVAFPGSLTPGSEHTFRCGIRSLAMVASVITFWVWDLTDKRFWKGDYTPGSLEYQAGVDIALEQDDGYPPDQEWQLYNLQIVNVDGQLVTSLPTPRVTNITQPGVRNEYEIYHSRETATIYQRQILDTLPGSLTLTVNTSGLGSVARSPDQQTYAYGDLVTLIAQPTSGWRLDHWVMPDGSSAPPDNPLTIEMTDNLTLTAVFVYETAQNYTLTISVVGGGSVSKSPDWPTYSTGTTVQVSAVPQSGWEFAGWTGDYTGPEASLSITMDRNWQLVANFTPVQASPPVARFSATPSSGPAPLTVQFTDTSSGVIDSWVWEFGDGYNSTERSPSHTYTSPGEYTVTLTVTGPGGPSSAQVNISVAQVGIPVASFNVSITQGIAPLTVQFSDTSQGTITSWSWAFGDGGTSTQQNPSHIYQAAGSYTARLTVTGPGGSTFAEADILVLSPGTPVASFAASPSSGKAPLSVQFQDLSQGTITSWSWAFGDGGTSTQQNPSHIYQAVGSYTVTLTVTGPGGTSTPATLAITVEEPGEEAGGGIPTWLWPLGGVMLLGTIYAATRKKEPARGRGSSSALYRGERR